MNCVAAGVGAALAFSVALLSWPCSAEPVRHVHFLGQLELAYAIGQRSYDGPTLGGDNASYSDHFDALEPLLALGVVYQLDERWGVGVEGVAAFAPSTPRHTTAIPGAPLEQFGSVGAEALARASFGGWLRPTFAVAAGFVVESFDGNSDAIYSPRLVAEGSAFQGMRGLTAAITFEPHGLQLGPLTPFCALRVVRLWRAPAAATLVMPALGVAFFP